MSYRGGLLWTLHFAVVAAVICFPVLAKADKRVALVIGNSAYRNVSSLDNPASDAKLLADTLRAVGFILVGGNAQLDLDKASLDRAVQAFGKQLEGADVGVFYYAGHGVQIRDTNYLVPVDANPTRELDVDFQMLDVNLVLRQMAGASTLLNIVILDACRNNPFGGRSLAVGRVKEENTRFRDTSSGLAQMRAPEGTLISFATQPGSVAQDGADGNSPYARALAETIRKPGLSIFETFNQVGLSVERATRGAQLPWVSSSPINGSFYFVPPPSSPAGGSVGGGAAPAFDPRAFELSFWESVRNSNSVLVIRSYLDRYPDGTFAPLARLRIQELQGQQQATRSVAPTLAEAPASSVPLIPRTTQQPSPGVDCVKPTEPMEFLICADAELAEWDGRMGRLYLAKRNDGRDKTAFFQQQVDWLKRRNSQCGIPRSGNLSIAGLAPAKQCVLEMTKQRFDGLSSR
jgi:uncharacterized protein YecT (DUF1311 family)